MNKIYTTITAIALTLSAFAQNPASTVLTTNFDGAFGGQVNPTGWVSANLTTPDVVSASAPGYGGSISAAKIVTKTINVPIPGMALPPEIPAQSGILLTGTIGFVGAAISLKQGQPFTQKPEGMAYWAKYAPVNTDSAFAFVLLTKWNSVANKRDTIGITSDVISSSLPTWTKRILPINYLNTTDNPDTLNIIFSSSSRFAPQLGSAFSIDEIILYPANTSGVLELENNGVSIFPNPAQNFLNINISNNNITKLTIYSIEGTIVAEEKVLNFTNKINIANLSNGLYFISASDSKNNVVSKSKFEVIR